MMGRIIGLLIVGWLLLGIFSFLITEAMAIFLFIKDFFVHTIWGWLAALSLIASFIFAYASKTTYEEVSLKNEIINSLKNTFTSMSFSYSRTPSNPNYQNLEINMDKNKVPNFNYQQESLVDMTQNIDGVLKSLAKAMNKPFPVFLKGWGNRRLELDVERVNILKSYVTAVRGFGNEFIELHADAIFSYEKLQSALIIRRDREEYLRDELKERHLATVGRFKHEQNMRVQTERSVSLDNDRKALSNAILENINKPKNWSNMTPDQKEIILAIINPNLKMSDISKPDELLNDLDRLQDILRKGIDNDILKVELDNITAKYKRNNGL